MTLPVTALQLGARLFFKSIHDLHPGSETLLALDADNKELCDAIRSQSRQPTFLPKVFHAGKDNVVKQKDFPGDPPFKPIKDHTHSSVCKPTPTYTLPVNEVTVLL
jgi:hypothetical protein